MLAAIHTAVGQLVGEGADKISFPVIADRAGVNPTTLYRRWDDVDALLEEVAVASLTRDGRSLPDTGAVETDLRAWAEIIAHDITRPERTRYLRAMVSARVELVSSCAVTDARVRQAEELVQRAVDRGEATPTAGQILDHVIAPLYYRVVFGLPVDDSDVRRLVRDVFAMVTCGVHEVVEKPGLNAS